MNKKIAKLVVLAAFAVGTTNATEMRSPYLSERGPIRYTFEKENPDRYSLNIYSGMYTKKADKAFMKHGTDTHPLSTLFFNKADFSTVEILPNSTMLKNSENYNPYIALGKLSPRVRYFETGVNVGGRFEYPVYKDKGRIGVRLNIPFTTIELEREDFFDKYEDPIENYRVDRIINIDGQSTTVRSYRLDFINEMWVDANITQDALVFSDQKVEMYGKEITSDADLVANDNVAAAKLTVGLIQHDDTDTRPVHKPVTGPVLGFFSGDVASYAAKNGPTGSVAANGTFISLGANDTGWVVAKGVGFYVNNAPNNLVPNYNDGAASLNLAENQTDFDKNWVVFGWTGGAGSPTNPGGTILEGANNWTKQFADNPYYWFQRRDFSFETDRRTGFGDIDLDLFYEHTFSDEWVAEAMLGLKLPTGTNDDYFGNPYRVHLGNGEHWEIKLGAMGAWMPLDWMNVRLDGRFAFVLESSEQRCAGFKGAQIKNIGPQVAADVDWQYLTLNLDFTFFHPKTDDLSLDVGYEFYYKTKDDVDQKRTRMPSWLGDEFVVVGQVGLVGKQKDVYGLTEKEWDLDNGVLEGNTQSISHKVRCESSYRFSDWFEMYAGGSFIFAGKNIPREADLTLGMNVRY